MRIEVWGELRVTPDGGPAIGPRHFPGVKPKQLLQVLVAERGHSVSKSRLADRLWADTLPQNYLATLETYVSVLRQTLEPGVRARDSVVLTERGGYRLDMASTTVDLDDFDLLVRSAGDLPPVAALSTFSKALALVRGQVLEDEPYSPWAEQVRTVYTHKHVQALVDVGRLALITGEAGLALSSAEKAVALDPLAESAYQILMAASYALWRQEDALRAFDRCRTLLADELGVDPMDETVALHLAILRHEDVASLSTRRAPQPITGRAPATVETDAPTGLLGRGGELAQLQKAVKHAVDGHLTVVLVVGDSGIGKTRLAEALASSVGIPVGSNRCSDLEVDLPYMALSLALRPLMQDLDSPMPVVSELLRRADLAQPFDQFARMRVMESLASTVEQHSPFLLLLDDAQWADADSIATLGYLRRRCPTAPVVVVLTCPRTALRQEALGKLAVDLRLDLGELSEQDVAPLGSGVFAATNGHPLFVADWLEARHRQLTEGYTPALRERVITRCWDLGPQAYRLLTVASLLDEPFSPAVLAELVGASDDVVEELDRLVDEQLLVAVGEGFRLRYGLVRRILAETFSAARRGHLLARSHAIANPPSSRYRRSTDERPDRRNDGQVQMLAPGPLPVAMVRRSDGNQLVGRGNPLASARGPSRG